MLICTHKLHWTGSPSQWIHHCPLAYTQSIVLYFTQWTYSFIIFSVLSNISTWFEIGFVCVCVRVFWNIQCFCSRPVSDVWLFLAVCSPAGAFGWVQLLVFLPVLYLCACTLVLPAGLLFSRLVSLSFFWQKAVDVPTRRRRDFNPIHLRRFPKFPREDIAVRDERVCLSLVFCLYFCACD